MNGESYSYCNAIELNLRYLIDKGSDKINIKTNTDARSHVEIRFYFDYVRMVYLHFRYKDTPKCEYSGIIRIEKLSSQKAQN